MNVYPNEICRDIETPRNIDVGSLLLYYDKTSSFENGLFRDSQFLEAIKKPLKHDQVKVFDTLVNEIGKGHLLFTLDAGPGTGKSFLVNSFVQALTCDPCYIVYSHNLLQLIKPLDMIASTTASFLCNQLKWSYFKTMYMFQGPNEKVIENVKHCIATYQVDQPIIILDEYSVVSPWFLVTLLVYCYRTRKVLLLVGDSYQQKSLECHASLRSTNLTLLKECSIYLTLTQNLRQQNDPILQSQIETIKTWVGPSLSIEHGKLLAQMFESKLNVPDDFSLPFLSQFHTRIKARTEELCKLVHHEQSFFVTPTGVHLPPHRKFLNFIPLIIGQEYIYMNQGCKQRVFLEAIYDETILVRTVENLKLILTKILCNSKNTQTQLLEHAKGHYQYPISLPFFTFHSVQGLTIDYPSIDLDVNTRSSNSLYVGFSRLQRSDQLHKIYLDLSLWSSKKTNTTNTHTPNDYPLITVAKELLSSMSPK